MYDTQLERNISLTRNVTVAWPTATGWRLIGDDERAPPDWLRALPVHPGPRG